MRIFPLLLIGFAGYMLLRSQTGFTMPTKFPSNTISNFGGWVGPLPLFGPGDWRPSENSRPYIRAVMETERRYGLPRGLLVRLIQQESAWNPNAVNPVSGAMGLAQFMKPTADEYGLEDRRNPWESIDAAGRYLKWLHGYLKDWSLAVAGYNWGPGNVRRKGMAHAPKETRDYVDRIGGDILGVKYAQAVTIQNSMMG